MSAIQFGEGLAMIQMPVSDVSEADLAIGRASRASSGFQCLD